jgi:superfamily II DNA helicase RecQ
LGSWLPAPDKLEVVAKRRSKRSAPPAADLTSEDEELLESLRAWRLKAARGKPAYTVANNRTLETIATNRPQNTDTLAQIHGVGPAFIDRYGPTVLNLVAQAASGV